MSKERRLGRGLEALLGRITAKTEAAGAGAPAAGPPKAAETGISPGHQVGDSQAGPGLDDPLDAPYGETAPAYGDPSQQVRRRSLPGMGAVTQAFGGAPQPADGEDKTLSDCDPDDQSAGGDPQQEGHPVQSSSGHLRVPIRQIDSNPFQPRQDFEDDEILSLSDSLRAHGLLQPLVVRRAGDRYQLVAGERRLRAAVKAGWTEVPVQLVEAEDRQMAELALVENLQRKDLNPLEKAASFQRYLQEYGCSQEELAARLKMDRSTISNFIRLLELPDEVQQSLRQGKITQGHARSLLPLGDEREQVALCRRVHEEGLNVRQTEAIVQDMIQEADAEPLGLLNPDGKRSRPRRPTSEHVAALEQEFRAALGTRVKISHTAGGRGRLVIHFTSHEEFERIREHICGPGRPDIRSHAG